jgi:hypothetical protein
MTGLDAQPKRFAVARQTQDRYGIGERPTPNKQGVVTTPSCSSHGNDTDSDGVVRETLSLVITKIFDFRTTCVVGAQPYSEGETKCFAGMLPVPSE